MAEPGHWNRRQRDIATVAWVSFLMAAIASAVFFAMVDPEILDGATSPGWRISRYAGYAIGFFMFWMLTIATSILSIFLVRTERRAQDIAGHKDAGK